MRGNIYKHFSYVEALDVLASGDRDARGALASNPQPLPNDILLGLIQDEDEGVVRALASGRKPLTIEAVNALPFSHYTLASRKGSLPEEIIRDLAKNREAYTRRCIATRADLPIDLIPVLASDEASTVRSGIASRSRHLPLEILQKLATDESNYVRREVAHRRDLPKELALQLANDSDQDVVRSIAIKYTLSPAVLNTWATHSSAEVRRSFASRKDLTPEQIAAFAKDPDKWVRFRIASRRKQPVASEILNDLMKYDRDAQVRRAALANTTKADVTYNTRSSGYDYPKGKVNTLYSLPFPKKQVRPFSR
jgi:hypothetical protein